MRGSDSTLGPHMGPRQRPEECAALLRSESGWISGKRIARAHSCASPTLAAVVAAVCSCLRACGRASQRGHGTTTGSMTRSHRHPARGAGRSLALAERNYKLLVVHRYRSHATRRPDDAEARAARGEEQAPLALRLFTTQAPSEGPKG